MPNDYSIAIHDYITDKIERINKKIAKADNTGDITELLFQQGQLDELQWMRHYLAGTSDLKDFTYYQGQ